jgi:lipoprotein NlpI
VLSQEGRPADALEAYREAARLKPDSPRVFTALGYALVNAGRDEEAARAFGEGLRLDPRNSYLYRSRSYVNLRLAHGSDAAADAVNYLRWEGWRDNHSPYMVLAAHFGFRRAGQAARADKILEEAATRLDASAWPYPVIRYLRQEIKQEQLLAQATDSDKLTEAHAYIGLDSALHGKRDEAQQHFIWVRENGNKEFIEYFLALSELERLGVEPRP